MSQSRPEILLVARWPVGGIRTHLGYNYPAMVEADLGCSLVVPDDGHLDALRKTLPGADLVPVTRRGRNYPLWRTIRPMIQTGRYSLVHAHGLTAAAHAGIAGFGCRVPLVVTLHEPLRDAQFAGILGSAKRWLLGQALARASAVVVVSEDSRQNLLRYFPNLRRSLDRISVIPNGIDTERFANNHDLENRSLRNELALDDRTTLIGYLGRFMPEKGFPVLIEAIDRLVRFGSVPSFHLVAFGSGDYRREYSRQVERRGLESHVTLREFVPDVRPVLEQLDLVVVPSLWEASSLLSMEAMCASVPVLGSDCPGLREVLRNTPSRTVLTGSVAALETGLREALTTPWYEAAAAFAPIARRRFDVRSSARRLLELYSSLARNVNPVEVPVPASGF